MFVTVAGTTIASNFCRYTVTSKVQVEVQMAITVKVVLFIEVDIHCVIALLLVSSILFCHYCYDGCCLPHYNAAVDVVSVSVILESLC